MSFNPSEAASKIDKVEHTQGLNAAYDLFTKEINGIKQTSTPDEANAHIKSLTDDLSKRGVLPDLAVKWGMEERGMIADDSTFTKRELATYRSANKEDALVASMTTNLINRYSQLETRNNDWFGDGVSEEDLKQSLADVDLRLSKTVQNQDSQAMAEKLNSDGGRLFKQIASVSDNKSLITPLDMSKLLASDDLAKGYAGKDGIGFLSKGDRATIQQMQRDWNKAYMTSLRGDTALSLDEVAKAAKLSPRPAAYSAEVASAAVTGVAAGAGLSADGIAAAAAASVESTASATDTPPVVAVEAPPIDEKQTYTVKKGQGFDRIARDILRAHEGEFSEAEVIDLSAQIAQANGMTRDSGVIRDGMILEIPALAS